ncbi:alpha/beta hydrolase [Leptospira sp. WS92.C1]
MIHYEYYPALKTSKNNSQKKTPLLLTHGAWHGSWCWRENFIPYFQKAGFDVYSIDLRGHGNSRHQGAFCRVTIQNYVQDVKEVLAKLPEPPILIGHSMGGLVVQKILENTYIPKAILLASVPTHGVFRITIELMLKHPIRFLKMFATFSLYTYVEDPKLSQELFFSKRLSDEKAFQYTSQMQDESFFAFLGMLFFHLPNPKKVKTPLFVIGGEKDRFFHPWEVRRTAKAYKANFEIFPGMGHNMMLDTGWEQVAKRIYTYLSSSEEAVKTKSTLKKKSASKKKNKKIKV